MIKDTIKTSGELNIILRDKDGNVKQTLHVPNLVVDAGKGFIASRMIDTPAIMSHMAAGTSSTAAASNQTLLISEVGRAAFDIAATIDANTVSYKCTFGVGVATGALTEAGIFNSALPNAGTMLCRTVFPVINKGATDTLTINWNVTIN